MFWSGLVCILYICFWSVYLFSWSGLVCILYPTQELVWRADPYQFAAHRGVWSNAYTNFVLQEFIILHHEYH